eukprot:gene7622-8916_t
MTSRTVPSVRWVGNRTINPHESSQPALLGWLYQSSQSASFAIIAATLFFIGCFLPTAYCQTKVWSTGIEANGHTYKWVASTYSGKDAAAQCAGQVDNGETGYLVTITSLAEYNFIMTSFSTQVESNRFWISGQSKPSERNIFRYHTGPEEGQLLYDTYFDISPSFSRWCPGEPNLLPAEYYIHFNNQYGGCGYNNNEDSLSAKFPLLCEFGGLKLPFLPSVPTAGGVVVVDTTHWTAFNVDYATLKISLVKAGSPNGTPSFECKMINSKQDNISCLMPPGTGLHTVTFSDESDSSIVTTQFRYQSPTISTIFPQYDTSELVTVTVFLPTHPNAITCKLTRDLLNTKQFLPISITVDSANVVSEKAAVHYNNNTFYSCWNSETDLNTTIKLYAQRQKVEGLQGNLGVISSEAQYNFLKRICAQESLVFWQNIKYDPASPTMFTYLDYIGATGQPVAVWYNTISSQLDPTLRYAISMSNAELSQASQIGLSTLTEFSVARPAILSNVTRLMSTSGETIVIPITNIGGTFISISLSFGGLVYPSIANDFYKSESSFAITSGYGGPYNAAIIVDGKPNIQNSNSITLNFYPPTIDSITSTPQTSGGLITINGQNFSSNVAQVFVDIGIVPCGPVRILQDHKSIECLVPPGLGVSDATVKVSTKKSATKAFSYASPLVSSANSVGVSGGLITINGQNFYIDPSSITVSIGTYKCTNVAIVTDHTTITCTMPEGSGTHPIKVTVGTLSSNQDIEFSYSNPIVISATPVGYRVGGITTITGDYFGQQGLAISIHNESCLEPKFIDEQTLTCNFPGQSPHSGNIALYVKVSCTGVSGGNFAFLYLPAGDCPGSPPCSGHGQCISGFCQCDQGWDVLRDCSVKGDTTGPTKPGDNGTSIFPGKGFNFTTTISHLREISITGQTIKTLSLASAKWTLKEGSTLESKHQSWKANFSNDGAVVDLEFTIYDAATSIMFAGETLQIGANSVKYAATVSNWTFADQLNTVQVIYLSRASKDALAGCSKVPTDATSLLNEYQIIAGDAVLRARFAGRLISDGRIYKSTAQVLDLKDPLVTEAVAQSKDEFIFMTAIPTPHFTDRVTVDPSFRALLKSDTDSCDGNDKWKLPVIISCAVVGGAAIIVGSALYTKMKLRQRKGAKNNAFGTIKKRVQLDLHCKGMAQHFHLGPRSLQEQLIKKYLFLIRTQNAKVGTPFSLYLDINVLYPH